MGSADALKPVLCLKVLVVREYILYGWCKWAGHNKGFL